MNTDVLDPQLPDPAPVAVQRALIDRRVAVQAEIARLEAEAIRLDAQLVDAIGAGASPVWERRDLPMAALNGLARESTDRVRALSMELGAALRLPPAAAARELDRAQTLMSTCDATIERLAAGTITAKHADVIADEMRRYAEFVVASGVAAPHEVPDVIAGVQQQAANFAERMTPGRLRHALARAVDEASPKDVVTAHRQARAERRVWFEPASNGMTLMHALIPTFCAAGIKDRLSRMAWLIRKDANQRDREAQSIDGTKNTTVSASKPPEDPRNVSQITADLLAELMLASSPLNPELPGLASVRAHINIVVPAETLMTGADDVSHLPHVGAVPQPRTPELLTSALPPPEPTPPELLPPGRVTGPIEGPVDPVSVRHLAGSATHWNRLFRSPDPRALHAVDKHRPSKHQRRMLLARDERCRFVGCMQHAAHCDIDHAVPYAEGGPTHVDNLEALCPRHHRGKHQYGWEVRHLGGGVIQWRSPLGYTYVDEPVSTVAFTEVDDAPDSDEPPTDTGLPGSASDADASPFGPVPTF